MNSLWIYIYIIYDYRGYYPHEGQLTCESITSLRNCSTHRQENILNREALKTS